MTRQAPTYETCHVGGEPIMGDRWQAAIPNSSATASKRGGGFHWVSVCRHHYWKRRPLRGLGARREIPGEL